MPCSHHNLVILKKLVKPDKFADDEVLIFGSIFGWNLKNVRELWRTRTGLFQTLRVFSGVHTVRLVLES